MNDPMTRVEAENTRYRRWAGNPQGIAYAPALCAKNIPDGGRSVLFRQCRRKPGYGPDGLYCKQHAGMRAAKESSDET